MIAQTNQDMRRTKVFAICRAGGGADEERSPLSSRPCRYAGDDPSRLRPVRGAAHAPDPGDPTSATGGGRTVSRYDLLGVEAQLLEQYPALADHHEKAAQAGSGHIRGLIERTDAARGGDADAFAEHVASIQRSALASYAASVRGIVSVEDVARWVRTETR